MKYRKTLFRVRAAAQISFPPKTLEPEILQEVQQSMDVLTLNAPDLPVLRNLCLPVWAFVAADAGDYAHAVKVLGYLTVDLSTIPDWLRHWEAFLRLEEDLRATLDKEDFDAAWQVGGAASLDDLLNFD